MKEYQGRINVAKDTMLFVLNDLLEQNIPESTTKEEMVEMVPKIYQGEKLQQVIRILPYTSYYTLEQLLKDCKENKDINKSINRTEYDGIRYLEEAMIVVLRAKKGTYTYSINPELLKNLEELYTEENKKIAKRYEYLEKIIVGILNSYGVINEDFFRQCICKYMNEILSQHFIDDFLNDRLNLNAMIDYCNIEWKYEDGTSECESYVTCLDKEEIDVRQIAKEQKIRGEGYKKFPKNEILKRKEYSWDANTQNLYNFIKSRSEYFHEFRMQRYIMQNQIGEDIMQHMMNECIFESIDEANKFAKLYMEWYNNSPQYGLCGYSPRELSHKMRYQK